MDSMNEIEIEINLYKQNDFYQNSFNNSAQKSPKQTIKTQEDPNLSIEVNLKEEISPKQAQEEQEKDLGLQQFETKSPQSKQKLNEDMTFGSEKGRVKEKVKLIENDL